MSRQLIDSRQAETFKINDFLLWIASTYLNLLVVGLGIFCIYNIELERVNAELDYKYDYMCSQSSYIVGKSGSANMYKTIYVYCRGKKAVGHNFIRSPHVEKSVAQPLRYTLFGPDMGKNRAFHALYESKIEPDTSISI